MISKLTSISNLKSSWDSRCCKLFGEKKPSSHKEILRNVLLIILPFSDSFLAIKNRAVEICIEHGLFIIYHLFFYFYLVSSTLLEEESINVILETSVGQLRLCVCWSVTLSKRKDFVLQKHACGRKRLNLTLTFKSWSEIIRKALFCQIERYMNASWSHVAEKSWDSTKRQSCYYCEIVLLFKAKLLTLDWDIITIFIVLRGSKRQSICLHAQTVFPE